MAKLQQGSSFLLGQVALGYRYSARSDASPATFTVSCVVLERCSSAILVFTLSRLMPAHSLDPFYLTRAHHTKTRPKEWHGEERVTPPPSPAQPARHPDGIGVQGCSTIHGAGATSPHLPWSGGPCTALGWGELLSCPKGLAPWAVPGR